VWNPEPRLRHLKVVTFLTIESVRRAPSQTLRVKRNFVSFIAQ